MSRVRAYQNVRIRLGGRARRYGNLVTQTGLDWILALINGEAPASLSHIAVGADSRETSLGDDRLWDERARKPISNQARDLGVILAEAFWDKAEDNFHWRETGLIAGGTETLNSGILVARVVIDEFKDSRRTATISWELGVVNV